ncbi:Protein of unknown function [Gryllus bimaculatus]|nr:Protein of unknown function [Gryllus bimaculatus]
MEDLSDEEGGAPVTSQPTGSGSVSPTKNVTEATSLNPADKVTYTPGESSMLSIGMSEKGSPTHVVQTQQQQSKW